MMTNFDWNAFFDEGFLFQINQAQLYIGHGPFKQVIIDKENWFKDSSASNGLLIKPKFWDFLTESENQSKNAIQPAVLKLVTIKEFYAEFLKNVPADEVILPSHLSWEDPSENEFRIQFDFLQHQMGQEKLRKGVPISTCKAKFELQFPVQTLLSRLLLKIQNSTGSSWAYGYWSNTSGRPQGYLGYTPEILFSYQSDKKELEMMALAGTWSKSNPNPDFSDVKIQNEHDLVIDDIQSRFASSLKVEKSQTRVLELKDLFHLRTDLLVKSFPKDQLLNAVFKLHPTAALGLYPRNQKTAADFSKLTLQTLRSSFGGPFVFLHPNHSMGLVAIRRVDWEAHNLQIWAGCGILKESQFEIEFAEIQAKQSAIKKIFDLIPGL